MNFAHAVLFAVMLALASTPALAQDWIAERLRGQVEQLEHGNWTALLRGDAVPDGRKIRTGGNGRVDLVRGQESIALGPNTLIAVRDASGQKMTSVIQSSGVVTVTAERRNVQHFSVQTPVLAAVVKGTQFTVTHSNGLSRVNVDRGVVQVQDNAHDMVVDVTPGQAAEASQNTPVDVTGPGSDRAVYLIEGNVVPAIAREAVLRGDVAAEDALDVVRKGGIPNANAIARAHAGGQGNAASANAGPSNNNGNRHGNGGGPPAHSDTGGNNSGASTSSNGNGNGPPAHSNAGGNGGGQPDSSNAGGGGGPPAHSNAGGNSNSSGNGNGNGNGNGPPEHSSAGGNGKGNGRKDD